MTCLGLTMSDVTTSVDTGDRYIDIGIDKVVGTSFLTLL